MIGRPLERCCRITRGLVGLSAATIALALSSVSVECRAGFVTRTKTSPVVC